RNRAGGSPYPMSAAVPPGVTPSAGALVGCRAVARKSFGCRFSAGFARLADRKLWAIRLPSDARLPQIRAFGRDYPRFCHLGKHVRDDVPKRRRGPFAAEQLQLCFPTAAIFAHQSTDDDGLACRAWYLHADALEAVFRTTLVRVNTRCCASLPR